MSNLNPAVEAVTARIVQRSAKRRRRYLDLIEGYDATVPARTRLADANQAHGFAGCAAMDKEVLKNQ